MNKFRSHNCGELSLKNNESIVYLSGWVNKKRDHGGLLFVDLRDHYGLTQCVFDSNIKDFNIIESLKLESVLKVIGKVVKRSQDTINKNLPTGDVEIMVQEFEVLNESEQIPFQIAVDDDSPEEQRLKFRYLDLRRDKIHKNIILRSKVINRLREKMLSKNFLEIQTPILTASSPEGARDFLVPSRLNKGKFYALPQAPQIFKQLLMVSNFDKYFQIAPCFRDEDARADRSPGEFYQLDFEMAFAEQDDIFNEIEPVIFDIFEEFSDKKVSKYPFERIKFKDSINNYGTDKPDLRNPLIINDISEIFKRDDVTFEIFKKLYKSGASIKCIVTRQTNKKPRSFFDNIDKWAKQQGWNGLAYFSIEKDESDKLIGKGPVGKFFSNEALSELIKITNAQVGDSIFMSCSDEDQIYEIMSKSRNKIAEELNIIDQNSFAFCWITDFPIFELDKETSKINFSHNPFSMPQGDPNNLDLSKPLELKAYQYDIVCNGIELSSGAIRNHIPDLMYKLFSIAGYDKTQVDQKFSGMINALSYGAPPHGGIAPGIDRIVMLLANEKNIREVTMFPMNQNAQDLMMNAPSNINESQLKELNLKILKKNN